MKFFIALCLGLIMFIPTASFAVGNLGNALGNLETTGGIAGTTEGNVDVVAGRIVRAALTLIGTLFFLLMVYAGYLWMTARGSSEQVDKAKSIVTAAIIGLVIVISAYAITVFVTASINQ